jgi:chemotaxis protein CheX
LDTYVVDSESSQPIGPEWREHILEPFVSGATLTLREWAHTEVVVRAVYRKSRHTPFGEVAAILALTSGPEEWLVLSFPEQTASILAGRMLGREGETLETEMIHDCVGEMANVIAGQAKAQLAGTPHHFSLATPTVVTGDGPNVRNGPCADCMIIVFGSDVGDFALQVFMKS